MKKWYCRKNCYLPAFLSNLLLLVFGGIGLASQSALANQVGKLDATQQIRFNLKPLASRLTAAIPLPDSYNDITQLAPLIESQLSSTYHQAAYTWTANQTVAINLQIPILSDSYSGLIKLHISSAANHGLNLPARVDIYQQNGHSYQHLGEWQGGSQLDANRTSEWLLINLESISRDLVIVIHPQHDQLNLQKIEVYQTDMPAQSMTALAVSNAIEDSSNRIIR